MGPGATSGCWLADRWGRQKKTKSDFFIYFPINIEVEIKPEKIGRDVRKIWKHFWSYIRIFETSLIIGTLSKVQRISNENWNSDLDLNLKGIWFKHCFHLWLEYNLQGWSHGMLHW
jgi:hypothetical protein